MSGFHEDFAEPPGLDTAPTSITNSRNLLAGIGKQELGNQYVEANSVQVCGFMEGMHMPWHTDGEDEIGETICTLCMSTKTNNKHILTYTRLRRRQYVLPSTTGPSPGLPCRGYNSPTTYPWQCCDHARQGHDAKIRTQARIQGQIELHHYDKIRGPNQAQRDSATNRWLPLRAATDWSALLAQTLPNSNRGIS